MSNTAHTAAKPNIYQIVTDRIIHSFETGVIPWEKPWKTPHFHGGPFPRNFRTGKPYRGVNVLLLWSSPYSSPFWLTFKQAQELKGTVRKGEKVHRSFFTSSYTTGRTTSRRRTKRRNAPLSYSAITPSSTSSSATASPFLRSICQQPPMRLRQTKPARRS
jgi:antirestriction protein ArdC